MHACIHIHSMHTSKNDGTHLCVYVCMLIYSRDVCMYNAIRHAYFIHIYVYLYTYTDIYMYIRISGKSAKENMKDEYARRKVGAGIRVCVCMSMYVCVRL